MDSLNRERSPGGSTSHLERKTTDESGYRSRQDEAEQRDRSRSPPRQKKKDFSKGFKWKAKSSTSDHFQEPSAKSTRAGDDYKPKRHGGKDDRDRNADRNRERDQGQDRSRNEERRGGRRYEDERPSRVERYQPDERPSKRSRRDEDGAQQQSPRREDRNREREDRPKKTLAHPPPSQEFIVVTVNDRLGTKARIPCLPSDTIGDFKKLVAAQIGRAPYEIMLKRQSQRPFKDALTLADYEISNGVQLDLELDTGD